jgi:hypothetical protein
LQEEFLIAHLNGISEPFKWALELGCGFGCRSLLSSTNKLSQEVKLDFLVSDIQSLRLDKEYDLVILSEVLLHILPTDIASIIRKLITLSKKHIINIDRY